MEVNSLTGVLAEEHAGQQRQAVDLPVIAGNSPAGAVVNSLQRLTAFHARGMRLMRQGETPIRVNAPRDLNVQVEMPCRLEFLPANNATGAAQESHNHAEWETFTRTLLAVHRCIQKLTLRILALPETPERFYQGFSIGGGKALIDIIVPSTELPSLDAMENYLRYLMRLRCPRSAALLEIPNVPQNSEAAVGNGHGGLDDSRLLRIMEATMDMPFLEIIAVHLRLPGPGPHLIRKLAVILMHDENFLVREQQYEASECLAQWLNCERANTFYTRTTIGASTQRHVLLARRELTGSQANLAPYLLSLRHLASRFGIFVTMRSVEGVEEDSTDEAAEPE